LKEQKQKLWVEKNQIVKKKNSWPTKSPKNLIANYAETKTL